MAYQNVTFALSLPRSRTAWLAETFAVGAITMHDPLKDCASIDELRQKIDYIGENYAGPVFVVDTSAVFFFDEIKATFPGARYVLIERDPDAVVNSLVDAFKQENLGGLAGIDQFERAVRMSSERLVRCRRTLMGADHAWKLVKFDKLSKEDTLLELWQFMRCDGMPAAGWFAKMIGKNVQVSFREQERRTNRAKLEHLFQGVQVP
ncbi:MAG: sulfotransferase [Arenimonas sp.]